MVTSTILFLYFSNAPKELVKDFSLKFIKSQKIIQGTILNNIEDPFLKENVDSIKICEANEETPQVNFCVCTGFDFKTVARVIND